MSGDAIAVLERALKSIETEDGWEKHFKDIYGTIKRAAWTMNYSDYSRNNSWYRAVQEVEHHNNIKDIVTWNDMPGRKREDAVHIIEMTLLKLREHG